jgi:hypothetical protein
VGVWTPFSLWPQISYNFSAGGVQRSIDFRWPFILPLVLGAVALLLVVRKHFTPVPQEKELGFRSSKLEAES